MKALIYQGVVIGVDVALEIDSPNVIGDAQTYAGLDLSQVVIVDCADDVAAGWLYDASRGILSPPPPPAAPAPRPVTVEESKMIFTASVMYLAEKNIITPERATEILSGIAQSL